MVVVYQAEPSALNFPVSQTIGDSQISLDMTELIIDKTKIDCNVRTCHAYCSMPETGISKLRRNKSSKKRTFVTTQYSNINTIETNFQVSSSINIMIGNVDLAN